MAAWHDPNEPPGKRWKSPPPPLVQRLIRWIAAEYDALLWRRGRIKNERHP